MLPFEGLKVVELAGVLAGPSVGYFFAELGAHVTKIEPPGGDITRRWKLPQEDPRDEGSAYFWSVNGFKEIIRLDLAQHAGIAKLHALAADADIVITSYKKGDAEKLRADAPVLRAINPRLIYAAVTGFGDDEGRLAYDLILQAESGFMSMNGEAGAPPLKLPVAVIDLFAGHQLKEAVLIALLKRERTGTGSYVEVSLYASAVASLANQATNWLVAGVVPEAAGSLHPNIAPYGEIFQTADGRSVTFAIGSDRQFSALCSLLGCPGLSEDPRFSHNAARITYRETLKDLLAARVRTIGSADLEQRCSAHNVPFGRIRNLEEVFRTGEARSLTRTVDDCGKPKTVVSSIAFRLLE